MALDLDALETSFDLVAPRGDELVDTFYTRLFAAAPAVKPLFAGTDLPEQKKMLLATLVLLRKSLRDLGAIVPKLRELGRRHVAYGARPEHYPVVGPWADRLDGRRGRRRVAARARARLVRRGGRGGRRDARRALHEQEQRSPARRWRI